VLDKRPKLLNNLGSIACAGTGGDFGIVRFWSWKSVILTVVDTGKVGRAEDTGFVVVRERTGTSEDFRRARSKESFIMNILNIHVVEYLKSTGFSTGFLYRAHPRGAVKGTEDLHSTAEVDAIS